MHRGVYIYDFYRVYIRNLCVLGDKWVVLDAPIDVSPFIETSDADELPALARRCLDKSRSVCRQLVHTYLNNFDYTSISFSTLPAPEGGPYGPCTVICDKQFQKLNSRRAKTKFFILLINLRLFQKDNTRAMSIAARWFRCHKRKACGHPVCANACKAIRQVCLARYCRELHSKIWMRKCDDDDGVPQVEAVWMKLFAGTTTRIV